MAICLSVNFTYIMTITFFFSIDVQSHSISNSNFPISKEWNREAGVLISNIICVEIDALLIPAKYICYSQCCYDNIELF